MSHDDDARELYLDLPPNLPKKNGRPLAGYTQDEPLPYDEVFRLRCETICRLLDYFDSHGKPVHIGRQLLIAAYLAQRGSCRSQKELSQRLGTKSGETSSLVARAKRDLERLLRQD